MPNKYMHEFAVPSSIDNTHHVIGLNGTANERIPMAMLTALLAANILTARYQVKFVDLLGNNATAITGRQDKAYSTLAQAMAAASANDTIIVFSCAEGAEIVLKDTVNIIFVGGAAACVVAGFRDDGVTVTASVSGKFSSTQGFNLTAAASNVEVSNFIMSGSNPIVTLFAGAQMTLTDSKCLATNATPAASPIKIGDGCALTMINCRMKSGATNHRALDTNSTGILKVKDSILISAHTESIDAAAANNVFVYGALTTNKAKNANVTIKIGNFVVDVLADLI